ncbi:hypothetical protein RUND412_002515 [Rhizina undulata]
MEFKARAALTGKFWNFKDLQSWKATILEELKDGFGNFREVSADDYEKHLKSTVASWLIEKVVNGAEKAETGGISMLSIGRSRMPPSPTPGPIYHETALGIGVLDSTNAFEVWFMLSPEISSTYDTC